MVCKVFSAEGKKLAKEYFVKESAVKASLSPGNTFRSERPRIETLEDIASLLKEGQDGSYALSYYAGEGIHRRGKQFMNPYSSRVLLLDVEWPKPEGFSWPKSALGDVARYILGELGIHPNTGCVIRPSASNGVNGYDVKNKPFRYHLALLLSEETPFEELRSTLEETGISSLTDPAIYRDSALLCIGKGHYGPGVKRCVSDEIHINTGPSLPLADLKAAKPKREFQKAKRLLRTETEKNIPEGAVDCVTASFLKKRPEESNFAYYTAIQHAVYRFGNAKQTIQWLHKYDPERRTIADLEAKERNAQAKIPEISNYFWQEYRVRLENVLDVEKPDSPRVSDWIQNLNGIYLCNWAEGSGKSTHLLKKILKNEKSSRVLYCCHRKAPCAQMAQEHESLSYYEDIKFNGGRWEDEGSLSICLPSLHYVQDISYDIVILDEAEQQLFEIFQDRTRRGYDFSQRDSELPEKKTRFENLLSVCIHARAVLAMDASSTGLVGHFLTTLQTLREGHTPLHLCASDFDWVRLKNLQVLRSEALLLQKICKEMKGLPFVLHTSFNNDSGRMTAWSEVLQEELGLTKEQVFLLDGQSKDEIHYRFKRNPDETIPELLKQGVRAFLLSPAVSTGFSYKGKDIENVYAIFNNAIFGCYDIKQTISRFRLAKNVTVAITAKRYSHREYGKKDSDDPFERLRYFASKKDLIERTELLSAFRNLLWERKIPFSEKEEDTQQHYIELIEKLSLNDEILERVRESYQETAKVIWKDYVSAANHQKKHLYQMQNFFTLVQQLCLEGSQGIDKITLRKCLLSLEVLRLVFKECFQSLHEFIDWYLSIDQIEPVVCEFKKEGFLDLQEFLASCNEEVHELMIPARADAVSWRSYLQQTCEFFHLDIDIEEAPSFKSEGTTQKGLARAVIQEMKGKGEKINLTGTVEELHERIDRKIRKPKTKLQRQYWRHRYPFRVFIRKMPLHPRARIALRNARGLAQKIDELQGLDFYVKEKAIEEYFFNLFEDSLIGQGKNA